MMYPLITIFFFVVVLSSTFHCYGQSECEQLRQEAVTLKERITAAEEYESTLQKELDYLKEKGLRLGFNLPPQARYYPLSVESSKYQDLRRKRNDWGCSDRMGGSSMNYTVFLRTYKRDSLEHRNEYLKSEIQKLDQVLKQANQPVHQSPGNAEPSAHPTEGLHTQRYIFRGKTYVIAEVDPRALQIEIGPAPSNPQIHAFEHLNRTYRRPVLFAMNAGMFDSYREPIGLLIKDGRTIGQLNRNERGYGNFYMQPNGVFYVNFYGHADVVTTRYFSDNSPYWENIRAATQSGPMMIIDSQVNPAFTPGSRNVHFRNAVGVTRNGKVIFAISKQQVNFYEFASFLLDLGCENALYLDGTVSRMYLPAEGETSAYYDSNHLGPVFYILE